MADKRVAVYIRASCDKQARSPEGTLKNQEQQLRQFVQMKDGINGESWGLVNTYIDGGKSGKDTNRRAYQDMLRDIQDGKINTVLVAALSRISRSVRDLLDMVDSFHKRGIDFICLKENFDTTTAQGKCFLTIMAALNQFEREQTSERTRVNMHTRATRGMFHGGHLLGLESDPNKKGNLIPNEKEARLVRHIFDVYLDCASIEETTAILNKQGYTSKSYISGAGKSHGGKKFCYSAVRVILTNYAFVGVREINKLNKGKNQAELPEDRRYSLCKAVWEPIVDRHKFDKAQVLLKDNCQHKYNGMKPTRHFYLFNGGLLSCHICGSRMEGRSTRKHFTKRYFYYYCTNNKCGFKVPENELEAAVQHIVKNILSRPSMVSKIAEDVNNRLHEQLPRLKALRQTTESELNDLKKEFTTIATNFLDMKNGKEFIEAKLSELDRRKAALGGRLEQINLEISCLENKRIDEDKVRQLFGSMSIIFKEDMKPYQKRILLTHLLTYLRLCNEQLKLGIDSSNFRSDITQVLRFDGVHNVKPGSHV